MVRNERGREGLKNGKTDFNKRVNDLYNYCKPRTIAESDGGIISHDSVYDVLDSKESQTSLTLVTFCDFYVIT